MKKWLSLFMALFILFSSCLPLDRIAVGESLLQTESLSLNDIKGHWAENTVLNFIEKGIIQGYPDGTFKPDHPISRAELVSIVNASFGYKDTAAIHYRDVSAQDWFYHDLGRAQKAGYITGYEDGTFRADAAVTRQEVAVMLSRLLHLPVSELPNDYIDAADIPEWSKQAIGAVIHAGIMMGYGGNTVKPGANLTRAESVTVLGRAAVIDNVKQEAGKTGDSDSGSGPAPSATSGPVSTSTPSPTPVPAGSVITDFKIESTAATGQSNVPITFGQVFAEGDVAMGNIITGTLSDGRVIPIQVDVKAAHPDGSLRHGIISVVLPKLDPGKSESVSLKRAGMGSIYGSGASASALLDAGFTASVNINLGGQTYSASADTLLKAGQYKNWLSGPVVSEWLVSAPLKNMQGAEHPHLTARFAVRSFAGLEKAKVDVIIENNWVYEPGPQNFIYDAEITIGGHNVYSKTALTHYHHARWKKSFWWGNEPQTHIRQSTAYIMASKAVPNYDTTIHVPESVLNVINQSWSGTKIEPMGAGTAAPYMPQTGGRPDIGLLPGWAATYLLSMDRRAKEVTLGNADLAGSWSAHYRDKNTDRPVSIVDYPYMSILGNPGDKINPATKKSEAFPACGGNCSNPNVSDSSHQPNFAYLPYLVTGDHYYLEELQFWAMYNMLENNPHYRDFSKGLLKSGQVRGQAWALRTISEAAYITPDKDPLKSQFATFVDNNLDWYNANYTNNAGANSLGVLTNGYAVVYNTAGPNTGLAPWQDDFFTQAVGHAAELGFAKAKALLDWKARFPISRMTDPGYCWINGAAYSMKVRDSEAGPLYTHIGQAYKATFPDSFASLPCAGAEMAANLGLKIGEMTGYSYSNAGYPSNMQPALAYSADSGADNGGDAWKVFMSRNVKPDYEKGPQFSIIPRTVPAVSPVPVVPHPAPTIAPIPTRTPVTAPTPAPVSTPYKN